MLKKKSNIIQINLKDTHEKLYKLMQPRSKSMFISRALVKLMEDDEVKKVFCGETVSQ